jgi:hypothetical protein
MNAAEFVALFRFTDDHSSFTIKLVEMEKISHVWRILNGKENSRIHVLTKESHIGY